MAYPTDNLALVLTDIDRRMISIKSAAARDKTKLLAGPVFASLLIDEAIKAQEHMDALTAAAATPGIVQYAKDQKNDQGLDVVTEFNAVRDALEAVKDWIVATFPLSGGFLLRESWDLQTGTVDRTFSTGATAPLVILLDALIATID